MLSSHQGTLIATSNLQFLLSSGHLTYSGMRRFRGMSLRSWNLHAGREILANICAYSAPINDLVGIPIRTMAYSLLAFAALRLATVAYLLAIGDLIVHILTGSFVYILRHRAGSSLHITHQM